MLIYDAICFRAALGRRNEREIEAATTGDIKGKLHLESGATRCSDLFANKRANLSEHHMWRHINGTINYY